MIITAKKDGSVKIAMDAKPIKAQIFKKYHMPNLLKQLDVAAQTINSNLPGGVLFTSLDLKYAFSQLQLSDLVSNHCNLTLYVETLQVLTTSKPVFMGFQTCLERFKRQWTKLSAIFRVSFPVSTIS